MMRANPFSLFGGWTHEDVTLPDGRVVKRQLPSGGAQAPIRGLLGIDAMGSVGAPGEMMRSTPAYGARFEDQPEEQPFPPAQAPRDWGIAADQQMPMLRRASLDARAPLHPSLAFGREEASGPDRSGPWGAEETPVTAGAPHVQSSDGSRFLEEERQAPLEYAQLAQDRPQGPQLQRPGQPQRPGEPQRSRQPQPQQRPGQQQPPAHPGRVDWGAIRDNEGGNRRLAYVPPGNNRRPHPNSGVTVGPGLNLGDRSVADLRRLGLSDGLVREFTRYLGLRGQAAQNMLDAHPFQLTPAQVQEIERLTFRQTYNQTAETFNRGAVPGLRFEDLPAGAQTAITDIAHQYGPHWDRRTPNFYRQVTQGRWQEAYDNLRNFGDEHGPRRTENADWLLRDMRTGRLPQARPNGSRGAPGNRPASRASRSAPTARLHPGYPRGGRRRWRMVDKNKIAT